MGEDIIQQTIKEITDAFQVLYKKNKTVALLLDKVQAGTATYAEAHSYSIEVSKMIGQAWSQHISSVLSDGHITRDIASQILPSTLDKNFTLVSTYAVQVQQAMNTGAGIGLKAQVPAKNKSRVEGMVKL